MKFHSHIGTSAYVDLLRSLNDETISEIRGKPVLKTVGNKKYWYDNFRLGTEGIWRYIGEDNPTLRKRLDRVADIKAAQEARTRERRRLVRILRSEGYLPVDVETGSVLQAFERAGVFRLGGTIVGTVAFRLYEGELGVQLSAEEFAQTQDIDIASFERLSVAVDDQITESVDSILSNLSFSAAPSLERGKVWRWTQSNRDTMVEFLTPAFGEETMRDLPSLGVSAQSLRHLNFLIARPVKAVALYRSGILVQIPRPEAFAIHKLIVADRRRGGPEELKSRKDRAQSAFLVRALAETRPDELAEAYEDALSRGPKWRERLENSLKRMPETSDQLARVLAGTA